MTQYRRTTGTIAAVAALALTATACSSKSTAAGDTEEGGIKTGPGVTKDTITIGVMSDLTKVFGPLGKTLTAGNQLYFDSVNANGGICEREVKIEVRDHAYDVQQATTQFAELEPKVAGFVQILGSPIVGALQPQLQAKKATAIPATWSHDWLGKDGLVLVGGSYAGDMINGLDYLVAEGKLKEGDTVGHIGFKNDLGLDAMKGSEHAAEKLGLKVKKIEIAPTDTDLSAQVNTLVGDKVKAILVSAGPKQTASAAGVASAAGLDVPFLVNGPGFDPALLDTPAKAALEKNLYVATSYEPYAGESEGSKAIKEAYDKAHADGKPTMYVNYGYASAKVMGDALQAACDSKDLSREGVAKALRSLTEVQTDGVMPAMDLSKGDAFPTTDSYISVVDAQTPGGLKVVKEPFTATISEGFGG
ncbi:ABC transporter substrate-binding protein [Janibacter sp. YIM B02568]|uniref:ABC transporter substrate-binding protein n=1 Tax=Janibacter endophyticus TaxID=2806261 RepID=UPI0019529DA1|nr:ABC transporter substrate-binding protein [Janibacter endophyticus]MBM6545361.1 ABC transporter substrate-binding protein [Janibacter endophyticus]